MKSYAMFIPPKAKTVVEFGCGDGRTGQEFKRIQPATRYFGMENDEASVVAAAKKLDFAILGGNINFNYALYGITAGSVDCLVYHGKFLANNWREEVKKQLNLLAEDGQALFVIDNGSYLPNILAMAQGGEPLLEMPGSLDATLAGIKGAGYIVDNVFPLYSARDAELKQNEAIRNIIGALGNYYRLQNAAVNTDVWAKAYVARAVKQAPPPRLMVQTMIGEERVTARVRVRDPHAFIGTIPGVDHLEQRMVANLKRSANYPQKVLIQHRLQPGSVAEMTKNIAPLREHGYLLMSEIDDSPDFWRETYEQTDYIAFAGCHAVQVSTEPLKKDLEKHNPHIVVFANHLKELPSPKDFSLDSPSRPINIFFGALNREDDWAPIMPLINRVIRDYPDKIKFTVMFDKGFFAALETPHKKIVGQEYPDGYAPYQIYADTLHQADIALLPLEDSERSRMKSDLKFIESAGHSVAVLASPTVYAAAVRDGGTGFIYRNQQEFAEKLRLLIENRELRQNVAESAYDYVKRHRLLSQHYEERVLAYRELLDRWQELDDDLSRRLAKINEKNRNKVKNKSKK